MAQQINNFTATPSRRPLVYDESPEPRDKNDPEVVFERNSPINRSQFQKYFSPAIVSYLFELRPSLEASNFRALSATISNIVSHLRAPTAISHAFSIRAAKIIACIAKNIDPERLNQDDIIFKIAMNGLKNRTWQLDFSADSQKYYVLPIQ